MPDDPTHAIYRRFVIRANGTWSTRFVVDGQEQLWQGTPATRHGIAALDVAQISKHFARLGAPR